jgi:preprotein translocase subunit SecB
MAITDTDGTQSPAGNGQTPGQPQVFINAQYVKDLSFENPRAPQSFLQNQQPPEVKIGVDVKAQGLAPSVYEVLLTIQADAKTGSDRVFLVELVYAAVATVQNVPEPEMARVLLVDTPRLMFPFARAIIADATRDGGFMPLLLRPIDFDALMKAQVAGAPPGQPTAVA